ncbi:hypothetical protein [Ruegeria arenilitoris]|uniref:hypothetical protein n=1 Tax=Ruegeria arenilitoris TaxID=1173585 RepID=UPI00147DAE3A|nr:hypothetical protein [Ruegeria arenilitoris]
MPTNSRSRKKAADEKYFPIKVRVCVPEEGFGQKMNEIQNWLNECAGIGHWGWNGDMILSRGSRDAMSFYLLDIDVAVTLIERFGLTLATADPELCGEGSFKFIQPVEEVAPASCCASDRQG